MCVHMNVACVCVCFVGWMDDMSSKQIQGGS